MDNGSTLGLLFEIAADPSKAITATGDFRDKAGAAIREFEDQLASTMTKSLGITKEFAVGMAVGVGAVTGLAAAMFELADKASEVGERIYETSEKTGMSAEALSGLNAISKETGGNFDSLSQSMARASVNLQKQIDKGPDAKGVLADIMGGAQGLAELGLKPMDERMQEVLHRIFEINDVGERNRALQELMGRGWQSNVETLKLLADQGYAPAIEKAKQFGIFFDETSAKKAKEFRIQWEEMKATLEGVSMMIGTRLIPAMSAILRNIVVDIEYIKQYGMVFELMAKGNIAAAGMMAIEIARHGKSMLDIMNQVEGQLHALTTVSKGVIGADENTGLKGVAAGTDKVAKAAKEVKTPFDDFVTMLNKAKAAADPFAIAMERIHKSMQESAKDMQQVQPIWSAIPKEFDMISEAATRAMQTELPLVEIFRSTLPEAIEVTNTASEKHQSILKGTESLIGNLGSALQKHHALEIGLMLAKASLRVAEETAQALSYLGTPGMGWAAAFHFASAAEYAVMAGVSAGSGGGGGGSSQSGVAPSLSSPGGTGSNGYGQPSGPPVYVIVSGSSSEVAQHVSSLLTDHVRYDGGQLVASETKS